MNQTKQSKLANSYGFDSSTNEDDFQKLMHICSSYGLNQQQTNQLIDQFKKGSHLSPEQSFNDSLNQSMADMGSAQKHQQQEYSFKHHPKQSFRQQTARQQYPRYSVSHSQRLSNKSRNQYKQQTNFSFQQLEKILTQKFTIEKGLVKNLQEENNRLKSQMQEKQRQISRLTQAKSQETEIIMGLKDIISNLTVTLKEKQVNFRQIHDKYNNLMETRVRQLSSKPSMAQISQCQIQDTTNLYQNSMRDSSCNKKSLKRLNQQKQNKQEYGYDKKRGNRIDVKKYKEMIQNLRSNC